MRDAILMHRLIGVPIERSIDFKAQMDTPKIVKASLLIFNDARKYTYIYTSIKF